MNNVIIVCTFLLTAYVSIRVMKSTRDQWLGMAAALGLNSVILGMSAWLLLRTDEQVRLFGIDHANRYTLIIALPVMTWVHFLMLSYARKRMGRHKNEGRA
ncbi:hypothetical protein PCCS19_42470 [Paenibacillus sp. CCS19]|uniref:hypothetical protein n=1 Tax=Paenibacillus sp. CCS19 TaxID=3158387 RepID=UPI00256BA5B8|nr:hypothetical protein [Paenibacillus cellulosilyticus]GMK41191.1 hypothetical protein PCCS19_42470 [Paenibacillus cellulosilyticus]